MSVFGDVEPSCWLIVIGAVVVMSALLMLTAPGWATTGVGGVGALAGLTTWRRRRRRLASP